jgi:hypothetical protein
MAVGPYRSFVHFDVTSQDESERVHPIDLGVRCDLSIPSPLVLRTERFGAVVFELPAEIPEKPTSREPELTPMTTHSAIVVFDNCIEMRVGLRSHTNESRHPLADRFGGGGFVYEVENSRLISGLGSIVSEWSGASIETKRFRHLIFDFRDTIIEVIASEYDVSVVDNGPMVAAARFFNSVLSKQEEEARRNVGAFRAWLEAAKNRDRPGHGP